MAYAWCPYLLGALQLLQLALCIGGLASSGLGLLQLELCFLLGLPRRLRRYRSVERGLG